MVSVSFRIVTLEHPAVSEIVLKWIKGVWLLVFTITLPARPSNNTTPRMLISLAVFIVRCRISCHVLSGRGLNTRPSRLNPSISSMMMPLTWTKFGTLVWLLMRQLEIRIRGHAQTDVCKKPRDTFVLEIYLSDSFS